VTARLVLLFRRRADLAPEEFLRYWREVHAPLVLEVPGIRRYVISPVVSSPDADAPPVDGMAELWIDNGEDVFDAPHGKMLGK
jgi:uncharacterized protein (TIGR02118 family)